MVNKRLQQRRLKINSPKMHGAPTVNVISGPDGAGQTDVETAPYFSLKVDTTARAAATEIILLDAEQGYQLHNNKLNPVDVVIEGLTDNYQFLLNDLAHIAAVIDIVKVTVSDKAKALAQYARKIEIYDSVRGSGSHKVKTIHPEMGVHEGQQLIEINTFPFNAKLTGRSAIVYVQEPGIIMTWGFYQKAELGRKA
ncbi:hypothetical protein [Flavilitoribacter nigricans]|uniref:Uncharacterized protein n=1 Tax=Flavilitoribacter nigricans (strain ATCC 23147 / DSM 23189 / NBRC 102662 / NCIMB 1420 / SS-2) TaxID=1122177 RepID=A0A2D0NDA4_FLAN2|nr:hypothetical protein [Flavilitoribacter nigricans]PHN06159.1 hypothetical protein CRP01_11280 [Flavilitoribacter nigricans DSM 23189 = NBRC 102662]